jgi:hypothetical protein
VCSSETVDLPHVQCNPSSAHLIFNPYSPCSSPFIAGAQAIGKTVDAICSAVNGLQHPDGYVELDPRSGHVNLETLYSAIPEKWTKKYKNIVGKHYPVNTAQMHHAAKPDQDNQVKQLAERVPQC